MAVKFIGRIGGGIIFLCKKGLLATEMEFYLPALKKDKTFLVKIYSDSERTL